MLCDSSYMLSLSSGIVLLPGLEITGAKAQIYTRKAAHCACKPAHCARVCHKTVYKNIDRAQLPSEVGQNCAWL